MRDIFKNPLTVELAVVAIVASGLLAAADYFGYAVFGDSAEQQQSSSSQQFVHRFHK